MTLCAVVFRASETCYLGVLRTLVTLGVEVVSVIWDWPGSRPFHSDHSKYLGRLERIPNPGQFPAQAREAIRTLLSSLMVQYREPPIVIPTSDSILNFLLGSPSLNNICKLSNGWSFSEANKMIDKFHLGQVLLNTSIQQPITFQYSEGAAQNFKLPFVVKPSRKDATNSFYSEFSGRKALFVSSESQRAALLDLKIGARYPLVIQEYIQPLDRISDIPVYLAVSDSGEIRNVSSVEKVFVYPEGFGTAYIVREQDHSFFPSPYLQDFIKKTALIGPVMLEFIRDKNDRFLFIECNARPWLLIDYQRVRGKNFFVSLNPSSKDELPVKLDASDYYIELSGFCRSFEKNDGDLDCDALLCALEKLDDSSKYIASFDRDDKGPFDSELSDLRIRYGRKKMKVIENNFGI